MIPLRSEQLQKLKTSAHKRSIHYVLRKPRRTRRKVPVSYTHDACADVLALSTILKYSPLETKEIEKHRKTGYNLKKLDTYIQEISCNITFCFADHKSGGLTEPTQANPQVKAFVFFTHFIDWPSRSIFQPLPTLENSATTRQRFYGYGKKHDRIYSIY